MNDVWTNGYKYLAPEYKNLPISDFADRKRIKDISDHYKKLIIDIFDRIQENPEKFNM